MNRPNVDITTAIWLGMRRSTGGETAGVVRPSGLELTSVPYPDYPTKAVTKLSEKVNSYKPDPKRVDEKYLLECCKQALLAVAQGNFGIGNCIVDTEGSLTGRPGEILLTGHNQLMYPHYRSDRHGEMVVLDDFEDKLASGHWGKKYRSNDPLPSGITLYTQLESCTMCLARIANSGIARCLYGAPDNGGGMVHLLCNLPPTYTALANRQFHNAADISKELIDLCMQCFAVTGTQVGKQLMNRAGSDPKDYSYCDPMFYDGVRERMYADPTGFYRDPGDYDPEFCQDSSNWLSKSQTQGPGGKDVTGDICRCRGPNCVPAIQHEIKHKGGMCVRECTEGEKGCFRVGNARVTYKYCNNPGHSSGI